MTRRIQREIEEKRIMNTAQAGFIKNRSCPGQILTLETIINIRTENNEQTHCLFIDIKKAFDSVDRNNLFDIMKQRGIRKDTIAILHEMYKNEKSRIIMNNSPSEQITIAKGVRQGASSSPVCFNFIPNELADTIENSSYGVKISNVIKIGILLYADDIVLIAPNDRELQELINITENWLTKFHLKINAEKTQLITYNSKRKPKVSIQGQIITAASEYKYLGFITGRRQKNNKNIRERHNKMEIATRTCLNILNSIKGISIMKKINIAKACINSIGLYASEATKSINKEGLAKLEKTQRHFARNLIGARQCAANETVLLDLGLLTIQENIDIRTINFRNSLMNGNCDFMKKIILLNEQFNTEWNQRYQRVLNKHSSSLSTNDNNRGEINLTLYENTWQTYYEKSIATLRKDKHKTTTLYRELNKSKAIWSIPLYLQLNGHRSWAISCIFGLRAGANNTEANQYTRHLLESPKCEHCNHEYSNERHIIDQCPQHEKQRKSTIKKIKKTLGNRIESLNLSQIVLYSKEYEEIIQTTSQELQLKLDNHIKNFITNICQRAHISER